jgi:hypothetical protein
MRHWFLGAMLLLAGCVSTEMKPFVGRDISEVFIQHGRPIAVFDLPDGRKAFQYRWGGGSYATPSTATVNAQTVGNWTRATITENPGMLVSSEGCLVTFIAAPYEGSYRVTEYRFPKRLVC